MLTPSPKQAALIAAQAAEHNLAEAIRELGALNKAENKAAMAAVLTTYRRACKMLDILKADLLGDTGGARFIAFNTGRQYSEAGQRIAAAQLPNGDIAMLDIDRNIDYLIPAGACILNEYKILCAYDNGGLNQIDCHALGLNQYRALMAQLRNLALTVKPLEA
jgi:hypothetical protein